MNKKTQISRLLQKEPTTAEAALWKLLRNRNFDNLKFRRQHPIKEYVVDFINIEYQIVIELDGKYHNSDIQKEKDQLRDLHLETLGYKVLRFKNDVVFDNHKLILQSIKKSVEEFLPLPQGEGRGEGIAKKHLIKDNEDNKEEGYTILSTKKLSVAQKELILNSGLGFVEYDAIKIELLEVEMNDEVRHAIFTSKNAVKAVLNTTSQLNIKNCYCVGDNTKKLLVDHGQNVIETAQNASDLAKIIVENYKNTSFQFFCGNLRRNELPDILKQHSVKLKEQIVYNTHMNSRIFDRVFDGILFFSPSGIQSYVAKNRIGDSITFCIGNTTASEAINYTDTVRVANKPTVENVIIQAIKYFKK